MINITNGSLNLCNEITIGAYPNNQNIILGPSILEAAIFFAQTCNGNHKNFRIFPVDNLYVKVGPLEIKTSIMPETNYDIQWNDKSEPPQLFYQFKKYFEHAQKLMIYT